LLSSAGVSRFLRGRPLEVVQREVSYKLLEASIFLLKLPQSFCLIYFHSAVLAFPSIEGLLCDVVLTDNVRCPFTSGMFLENLDDLFFRKSFFISIALFFIV